MSLIALSIRQPWAWLILRPDIVDRAARAVAIRDGLLKDIENRSWSTPFRGRLLVHAGKSMTRRYHAEVSAWLLQHMAIQIPAMADLPRGGVVGAVTVVDCVTQSPSRWFFPDADDPGGSKGYGFVLREPRAMPFVEFPGQLNFFDVPRRVLMPTAATSGRGAHD